MRWRGGPVNTLAAVVLLITSCGYSPREKVTLVDPAAWQTTTPLQDPFDDRPDFVDCSEASWGPEDLNGERSLGVETFDCNYFSASQPLLTDIRSGDPIRVRFWHFRLVSATATEAHVALAIDGDIVWDQYIPIPSDSQLLQPSWTADRSIDAGKPIVVHIHNHGINAYNLIEVTVGGDPI